MTQHMGKLIQQLRKQQKMTQKVLANGIVSEAVMSRIENGQAEPELFALNKLFQRLGKTLVPFEIIVSNREVEELKRSRGMGKLDTTLIPEGEYFKDIREGKGLSQEEFSSGVCARETISNIEHGRYPQRRKLKDVLKKQGQTFEKYHGYICASEYELYELAELYQQKKSNNAEATRKIRLELKRRLDMELPVNRQFIESAELMEKRSLGSIDVGEELAGLERCLRYTMPEYDGMIYRIPFRQEIVILEEIIKCMEELQRTVAARELTGEIKKKNEKKIKLS